MPIYEYLCQSCNHQFEKLQKISDEPLVDCPECAKSSLKKMVSASAFRLKGGGWYETDFKTGNRKNLKAGSESTKTSAASADSNPAPTSKESGSVASSNSDSNGSKKGAVKSSSA